MKRTSRKILAACIVALLLAALLYGCGAGESARAPGKAAAPVTAQPEGQTPPPEEAPQEREPAPAAAGPEQAQAETQGEEAEEADSRLTCTVSIRCDTLLSNLDDLDPEKKELVPGDGILLPETAAAFDAGESVFDVLRRETKRAGIHMEYVDTPLYNSAYIEGIGNLYEFDCGEGSGWMYKVNGAFPNCGSGSYALEDGDEVVWLYTCDLGEDIGGGYAAGQQGK
ncbi:MAG TPA: DUF4430 domain-containing protein [Candidatus Acidoferrum sp.]|nr:DUF4430 domain-containing protein [Candidatus Acidoferrum sp.]